MNECRKHPGTPAEGSFTYFDFTTSTQSKLWLCYDCLMTFSGDPTELIAIGQQMHQDAMDHLATEQQFAELIAASYTERELNIMSHPAYTSKMILDQED